MTLKQFRRWLRTLSDKRVKSVLGAIQEEGVRRGWGLYWWE